MNHAHALPVLLALVLQTAASAQVNLTPKIPEGKSLVTETKVHYKQILEIAGMNVETEANVDVTSRSTSGQRAADGKLAVQEKVEGIRFKLALPGNMGIDYDSAKPDSAKSDNQMLQDILNGIKARVDKTYTVVYDKDNKPIAVEGVDKIIAAAPQGTAAMLQAELNPEKIKREAAETLKMLPGKPVNKGDKWEWVQVQDLGAGQTFTFTHYLEYQGTVERDGKTLDKITLFTGDVKYAIADTGQIPFKLKNSDLKVDSSMGTIYFDRESGQVVEMSVNLHITGPMTLDIMGMELPSKLDLSMDTSSALKK
jgi:hypothetical protein